MTVRESQSDPGSESPVFFRAGVGAVIYARDGRVLVCERADTAGAWQFPQGGIDHGEEPEEAVWREVFEETAIPLADLALCGRHPDLLAYELPPEFRRAKTGRGQVQYWFFFRYLGRDHGIVLPMGGEFVSWRWATMSEAVAGAAPFRRSVYQRLATGRCLSVSPSLPAIEYDVFAKEPL